jgi:sulfate permease, SulP family
VFMLRRYLPILSGGAEYSPRTFTNDLIVARIITVTLISQSLAYVLLAGLVNTPTLWTRIFLEAAI